MTPAEARWVYDVVLTRHYKESAGAIQWVGARETRRDVGTGMEYLAICACRYGLCGRCEGGQPEKCSHAGWTPPRVPETHIVNRGGAALTRVWRSGKPCAWLCPTVRVGQLELFELAGGAR
jgi:hypothetical protein